MSNEDMIHLPHTITWKGNTYDVYLTRYQEPENYALLLYKENELYAVASVNVEEPVHLEDAVPIKNYSENEGIEEALIDAGIIRKQPTHALPYGYVHIPVHPLTADILSHIR